MQPRRPSIAVDGGVQPALVGVKLPFVEGPDGILLGFYVKADASPDESREKRSGRPPGEAKRWFMESMRGPTMGLRPSKTMRPSSAVLNPRAIWLRR